jgi:Lar family restriction alleviation protein
MTSPIPSAAVEALKPCPFCGGVATMIGPDSETRIYVLCENCRSRGSMVLAGHGGSCIEAIEAWNRRPHLTEGAEPVRKWGVERHDNDDGSISWEVWNYDPATYRRVVSFNDAPEEEGRHAKADAELIARLAAHPASPVSVEELVRVQAVQATLDECEQIALAIDSGRGNEKEIARAIRGFDAASLLRKLKGEA